MERTLKTYIHIDEVTPEFLILLRKNGRTIHNFIIYLTSVQQLLFCRLRSSSNLYIEVSHETVNKF